MKRPSNHATQAMQARLISPTYSTPMPDFTPVQVEWLKEQFPPKCIAFGEPLEKHLRYAGVSAFVEDVALEMDQRTSGVADEVDPEDDDGGWVEPNGPGD